METHALQGRVHQFSRKRALAPGSHPKPLIAIFSDQSMSPPPKLWQQQAVPARWRAATAMPATAWCGGASPSGTSTRRGVDTRLTFGRSSFNNNHNNNHNNTQEVNNNNDKA